MPKVTEPVNDVLEFGSQVFWLQSLYLAVNFKGKCLKTVKWDFVVSVSARNSIGKEQRKLEQVPPHSCSKILNQSTSVRLRCSKK